MPQLSGRFEISEQQNHDFAVLSGDYNPLHVDPVYARRLQFGRPVIHGVHHVLRVFDLICAQSGGPKPTHFRSLKAAFPNPVSVGQVIDYVCQLSEAEDAFDISAFCGDKMILSLKVQLFDRYDKEHALQVKNVCPPKDSPILQMFPPHHSEGVCDLYLDEEVCQKLFPNLSIALDPEQIALILSCTRIVGMKCPGMHSIFSRINLEFFTDKAADVIGGQVHYFENYKDERVQIMKVGVKSEKMAGVLDTFFRPTPVAQPSYTELCARVTPSEFIGRRALIIGGSRGVGETTAKILAAGGADVVVTYNHGRTEAQAVEDEINDISLPGTCNFIQLDVCNIDSHSVFCFADGQLPTHIYFFASPYIQANRSNCWDAELFNKFCRFYLQAFSEIVSLYAEVEQEGNGLCFFYPSSIYIEKPEKGFSEYAVAKAAGEALCIQLASRYKTSQFIAPRLPRMATDQTSSIISIKSESTFDVMYKALTT
jgi:hypothetical protein